jgi:hypothetical protein
VALLVVIPEVEVQVAPQVLRVVVVVRAEALVVAEPATVIQGLQVPVQAVQFVLCGPVALVRSRALM